MTPLKDLDKGSTKGSVKSKKSRNSSVSHQGANKGDKGGNKKGIPISAESATKGLEIQIQEQNNRIQEETRITQEATMEHNHKNSLKIIKYLSDWMMIRYGKLLDKNMRMRLPT